MTTPDDPTHHTPTPHGHIPAPVPYIPDGARVRLYDDARGTVMHDLGGANVPVHIDGVNDPAWPHDYTPVPRREVEVLSVPVNLAATLTLRRAGEIDPGLGHENVWVECDDCGAQLVLTQLETPFSDIERFRNTHPCPPQGEPPA